MLSDTRWWLAILVLSIVVNLFAVTDGLVQILCAMGISATLTAVYHIEPKKGNLPN